MPTKLELHNVSVSLTSVTLDEDDQGLIPPNLARVAETIIGVLKANGDLLWLADEVRDAINCEIGVLPYERPISEARNARVK